MLTRCMRAFHNDCVFYVRARYIYIQCAICVCFTLRARRDKIVYGVLSGYSITRKTVFDSSFRHTYQSPLLLYSMPLDGLLCNKFPIFTHVVKGFELKINSTGLTNLTVSPHPRQTRAISLCNVEGYKSTSVTGVTSYNICKQGLKEIGTGSIHRSWNQRSGSGEGDPDGHRVMG